MNADPDHVMRCGDYLGCYQMIGGDDHYQIREKDVQQTCVRELFLRKISDVRIQKALAVFRISRKDKLRSTFREESCDGETHAARHEE